MKINKRSRSRVASSLPVAIAFVCTLLGSAANAAVDVKNIPLKMAETVQPNVLFILDDSGSMEDGRMPDGGDPSDDKPSHRSSSVNTIYYNPTVTYRGWQKADGSFMANTPATAVFTDDSLASGNTDDLTEDDQSFYVLNTGATDLGNYSNYKKYILKDGGTAAEVCTWNGSWWSCAAITSFPWRLDDKSTEPTVAQEWQNFANWYSYHRTRMKSAKAGASYAFGALNKNDYRVGFTTIWGPTDGSGPQNSQFLIPVGTSNGLFTGTNRSTWFTRLFAAEGSGYTPLIPALTRAGTYFSDSASSGPYGGTLSNNKQLQCRQNFAILTTDGYWNRGTTSVGNADDSAGNEVEDLKGVKSNTYAPAAPYEDDWNNTLADVAMHYWKTDLRTDMANVVPTSTANPAFWQHMVTFGISIGLKGTIDQSSVSEVLKDGVTRNGNAVSGGWPNPNDDEDEERIDDLLHAAVNGHGAFVSASNPTAFTRGLTEALATIANRTASRANVSANSTALREGTFVYQGSYMGGTWTGELSAFAIHNKELDKDPTWRAASQIKYTNRKVLTEGGTFPTGTAQAVLSTDVAAYLKGDDSKELKNEGGTFRNRTVLLGDIAYSAPVFVEGKVPATTTEDDIDDTVYVGANDGMLHAFDAEDGSERFAYVPGGLDFAKLAKLSDPDYVHAFFVDGPIVVSTREQTRTTTDTTGKNILVGTLGRGGKGLYALDVTDPANPTVLWDNTWSDALGTGSSVDALGTGLGTSKGWLAGDKAVMGHIISSPFITKLNNGELAVITGNGLHLTDATSQVTIGETDQAALFVINLTTGALIRRIELPVPSTNNSLSAPRGWDGDRDGDVDYVYAGDTSGNLWKFDFTNSDPSKWLSSYKNGNDPAPMFSAKDANGKAQPITGGLTIAIDPVSFNRMILFGTGRFLTDADPADKSVQSMYGLIDKGSVISGRSELVQRTIRAEVDMDGRPVRAVQSETSTIPTDKKGWYLDLKDPTAGAEGERIVGTPRNENGALIITSGVPSDNPCDPNGTGFNYALNAFTGASLSQQYFDANRDGKVDDKDDVSSGGTTTPAAGVGYTGGGMLTDSIGLQGDDGNDSLVCGTFEGGTCKEDVKSTIAKGRISWREVMGK